MRRETYPIVRMTLFAGVTCLAASTLLASGTLAANTGVQLVQSRAPMSAGRHPAHTVPLSNVHSSLKLAALPVQDLSGQQFGLVQNVKMDTNGRPASIEVALNMPPGKTATISAAKVRYDQANNIVVAEVTPSEIVSLSHAGAGGN